MDRYLALSQQERNNFRLGRRTGYYRELDDMNNPEMRLRIDQMLQRIETQHPGNFDAVISDLMESFI
jgi:hypothetical protein